VLRQNPLAASEGGLPDGQPTLQHTTLFAQQTGATVQNIMNNIILLTDSYKGSHYKQYPPGTEGVYSYFESRGGRWSDIVFFGLQYYLKRYLAGEQVTAAKIDEAEAIFAKHFGHTSFFNRAGWEHILNAHQGRLPVWIKAVPEGSVVPNRNVLMTIENTDPRCYWLTNYLETLLVQVWYGSTVATQSREMKKVLLHYLEETGDPSLADFKMHDFGFRGVSSVEAAGVGGAAHLVSFRGTDTMAGLLVARDFYGCEMAGFSIPAAEHSTITSWGREHETEAYENMLDQFPHGAVAVVSDSYDIFRACREIWGGALRAKVLQRDGLLVIRPDSGEPTRIVPEVLDILGERFGQEANAKGYKVLHPRVRIIQGDGIDFDTLTAILEAMKAKKWSADNIAFGSGGGLLQKLHRDTLKFAFKCSSATVASAERDVFKEPITDNGKRSKAGRMKLVRTTGGYATIPAHADGEDLLVEVFRDGVVLRDWSFADIRARAAVATPSAYVISQKS
jgi:nicotinamide phosphoribosyltransferase